MLIYITTHCQISQHIFAISLKIKSGQFTPTHHPEMKFVMLSYFKIHWKITLPTSHLNAGLVVGGNVLHPHTATFAMS